MDSYSNKINRIKNTIDEIRDDIEKMKQVKIYLFFL
jgi:Mg2+ and Co2+ transporter CorA